MSLNVQTKPLAYGGNRFSKINSSRNSSNNYVSSINKYNSKPQNNSLVDINYGNLLVKTNKVSFTGLGGIKPSLIKKN